MDRAFALEVLALACLYWGKVAHKCWRFRRKRGRTPSLNPTTMADRVFLTLWTAIILAWFFQPVHLLAGARGPAWLAPVAPLDRISLKIAGSLLMWPAYAASLWAWNVMGKSWRLGIDRTEKTGLITTGPFAICRHPIYSLQAVALLGSCLVLPTPLLLAATIAQWTCIHFKSRAEERHMAGLHGDAYQGYCDRVGRLWPWPGRRIRDTGAS